jgi:hypothetical protein
VALAVEFHKRLTIARIETHAENAVHAENEPVVTAISGKA